MQLSVTLFALFSPAVLASWLAQYNVEVVHTTHLDNGHILDWIKPESQGSIASPPSRLPNNSTENEELTKSLLKNLKTGPPGTVPVLRRDNKMTIPKVVPPAPGSKPKSRIDRRQYAQKHWYASSSQNWDGHGTSGHFSMYNAYVYSDSDFSLLQLAAIRENVPGVVGTGYTGLQTVESGWIHYARYGRNPTLFTFYTTNGHGTYGDNLCSWNTDHKGWVQVDNTYYPGMEMTPLATVGGDANEFAIDVLLDKGNWWIGINGKWIGYYPASMFTRNGNTADQTLESKTNRVDWYGEVYQDEGALTTTDMGSGHFASEGYGKSAFIRLLTLTGLDGSKTNYNGRTFQDDTSRYTIDPHFDGGGDWGSYMFLGGPGAGGVSGG
ncbi:hypothetical protein VHEMI03171 [[Torrubiella] hemipterigena]|uniref:Neprosin PEP catalytic domain-containing protein n=1 Tax=[Torrubiella] hemipterigena TaxID=1531966 RepID=A0A0A1TCS1_9HYPO|nr:hypothetical protein VHEMI03171 [[Torrubiella] hemipterigena]